LTGVFFCVDVFELFTARRAALNVHEGPHSISRVLNAAPLVPGMVVSNEPGYYEAGAYGIRIGE